MNIPCWLSELGVILELGTDRAAWDDRVCSFFDNVTTHVQKHSASKQFSSKFTSEVSAISEALLGAAGALIKSIGDKEQHFQHTLVDVIGRAKAAKLMAAEVEGDLSSGPKLSAQASETCRALVETVEEACMLMSRVLVHFSSPKSVAAMASRMVAVLGLAPK